MSASLMVNVGIAMIAASILATMILNVVFSVTKKKVIAKIYNDIENN